MSDQPNSPSNDIHENHLCQHPSCSKWGCFGFEEAKGVMSWFCAEHQPDFYRGLPAFSADAINID